MLHYVHVAGHSFLKHQFRLLQRMSREHNTALCNTASTMLNRKLSRYPDIVPDDFNNSQLYKPVSSMNKDYINLLYVDGYRLLLRLVLLFTCLILLICIFQGVDVTFYAVEVNMFC